MGMVTDYGHLGFWLKKLYERWDHKNLNELEEFLTMKTTAENIARVAFEELSRGIQFHEIEVRWVEVRETEKTSARYYGT
jgi:6-pyruvoyl-tetrahydropterin synthase